MELTGGLSCSGTQRDFCKQFFHMWWLGLASFSSADHIYFESRELKLQTYKLFFTFFKKENLS